MSNARNAAIAAIAAASLSLSVMSVAQAHGGEKAPAHKAIYNTTRVPSTMNRETPKPDSTWPVGSPDRGGVG